MYIYIIICLDHILQMLIDLMKDYGFTQKKARSRRYPALTITDADDRALLTNTPTQSEWTCKCWTIN